MRGDVSLDASISYDLTSGLSIEILGGKTGTSSKFSLDHGRTSEGTPVVHYHQEMSLDILRWGAGIRYRTSIIENITIVAAASYHHTSATLDFYHEQETYGSKPTHTIQFKDNAPSLHGQVGVEMIVFGPIKLSVLADYRHLKFSRFSGNGIYRQIYTNSDFDFRYPVSAILVEGSGFFGVDIADNIDTGEYALHEMWNRTNATPWSEHTPAVVDLSGIGVIVGISVGL